MLIGSIFNGWNWNLYSRKNYQCCAVKPCNWLENIQLKGKFEIEKNFENAINIIKDASWQNQYENGFHLRMLLNRGNILIHEIRFLSNTVIWEWLYPHIRKENGATADDEGFNLRKIFNYILSHFWPSEFKYFPDGNILYFLRNQLAHSGKLPIDRKNAADWIKELI